MNGQPFQAHASQLIWLSKLVVLLELKGYNKAWARMFARVPA